MVVAMWMTIIRCVLVPGRRLSFGISAIILFLLVPGIADVAMLDGPSKNCWLLFLSIHGGIESVGALRSETVCSDHRSSMCFHSAERLQHVGFHATGWGATVADVGVIG